MGTEGFVHEFAPAMKDVSHSECHENVGKADWPVDAIFTVGHSTLPLERFTSLLRAYGIERLVDIRTVPRSRRNPQFNTDALADSLRNEHLDYFHMPALGG